MFGLSGLSSLSGLSALSGVSSVSHVSFVSLVMSSTSIVSDRTWAAFANVYSKRKRITSVTHAMLKR